MPKKSDVPQPMDPGAAEGQATPQTNQRRVCYSLQTLVSEFNSLFPETPVEYDSYDRRNTALDAIFDLTVLDSDLRELAAQLLRLIEADHRVMDVTSDEGLVSVAIKSDARTQDLRDSFGLNDAWMILIGEGSL